MGELKLNWNLDNIIKLEDFDGFYRSIESRLPMYDEFFKYMSPGMDSSKFLEFLEFDEKMLTDLEKLIKRASLMEAVNQKSEEAKMLLSRAKDLYQKHEDSSRKISHWIKGKTIGDKPPLDHSNAKRLFKSFPGLRYVLIKNRNSAKYTLSEEAESIIAEKDINGVNVLKELREYHATKLRYKLEVRGREPVMIENESDLTDLFYSHDSDERKAAYLAHNTKYKESIMEFFMIYQAVVKDWVNEAKRKKYKSPISMKNYENDCPDKAVEAMMQVCSENVGIFQDYFRWKSKQLGMLKLKRFDIYAPLRAAEGLYIPFQDAIAIVMNAFEEFSQGFASKSREITDANHIDSHPRKMKQSDWFCETVAPDITPYLHLNYKGRLNDVVNLAHEFGHGIHSLYSRHNSFSAHEPSLPLAETASTFAESLVFERLFESAESDDARKAMLSKNLEESYASIMRQNYFVKFEMKSHEIMNKGVTPEQLSDIYLSFLNEQFGESVDIDPSFKYEWASVSHIVDTPFYCYSYNFGDLLALSLFRMYKNEGSSFIPKIEKILSYGGSAEPKNILKEVGIDMSDRKFWQGSFDILRERQQILEKYG